MKEVILIVEDDEINMRLSRDLLQAKGYETLEAWDGKQGVEIAKEKKPDLILMDIQLPVMSGLEATKILKDNKETKEIPIIALTASVMKNEIEKIYEVGCDGYISKPVNIKEFRSKVAEYLEKSKERKTIERGNITES